ncbi:phage baseplate assembly protein V [Sphingomonas cavernae]|uniref:Phage baseplate assembly protein V n=1 Tax=Sphingomonas cavernae TaxID=2320861 RepID=A0A418WP44_9SPHN|nr:phage baseplate assembly protein V [Sphingomonas cavernae]RJF92990.1 phage baseplate assembly protein V [Sphingomonas cavernae]
MNRAQSEDRPMGDLIRLGTIAEVDLAGARCTVDLDDELTTDWVPWFAPRAGETAIWSPPSVGEQVLLISPEGDMESAVALLGVYSDDNPAPGDSLTELIRFKDGAIISYDPEAHALSAILPDGATAEITAPGGLTITGDVTIEGDVTINGKAEASEDVVGGGISLKSHKHGGVAAGGAKTAVPE